MNSNLQKAPLEIYGLVRMIYGLGQIVGLTAGYFFLEFIIKYPSNSILYVIDEEILALTYLAVLLRGLFHVVSGVGIARLQNWVRFWLMFGWPIMIFITFGLVYSIAHDLLMEGFLDKAWASLSAIKLLLYLGLIVFDFMFINRTIVQISQNSSRSEDLHIPLEAKKIATVFGISIFVFVLILFLGKPIKQGFHPGFYRSTGEKTELTQKMKTTRKVDAAGSLGAGSKSTNAKSGQLKEFLSEPKVVSISVEEEQTVTRASSGEGKQTLRVAKEKTDKKREGIPTRIIMGYLGALFLILALLVQVLTVEVKEGQIALGASSYVLFIVGFLLWVIYGIAFKLAPVVFASFVCLVLSVSMLFIRFK